MTHILFVYLYQRPCHGFSVFPNFILHTCVLIFRLHDHRQRVFPKQVIPIIPKHIANSLPVLNLYRLLLRITLLVAQCQFQFCPVRQVRVHRKHRQPCISRHFDFHFCLVLFQRIICDLHRIGSLVPVSFAEQVFTVHSYLCDFSRIISRTRFLYVLLNIGKSGCGQSFYGLSRRLCLPPVTSKWKVGWIFIFCSAPRHKQKERSHK